MFQQATRPRTHLRRRSSSPVNRAVSDELALGRHCHVLVILEETFRRRLRAVTHFMSLLKS